MTELTAEAKPSLDYVLGTQSSPCICKSEAKYGSSNSPLNPCPQCGSQKVWRDGLRYQMFGGGIQRWRCRDCGLRFSDPNDVQKAKKAVATVELIETKSLKSPDDKVFIRQICVKETKNLVTELISQKLVVPQKELYDIKDLKGAVVEFYYYLEKNERAKVTKVHYAYSLDFLINNGANLFDPINVKDVFTDKLKDKTDSRKYVLLKAYRSFANAYGIDIEPAKFKRYMPKRKDIYLPPEHHMTQLIASCSEEMIAFLQTLKETAARPVEAMRIRLEDVDFLQFHIAINYPAKNCNPRTIRISEKLINILKSKAVSKNGRLFCYKNEAVVGKTFKEMRKKAIVNLGIPELRKIHLYTFRYWRATVELQETGREIDVAYLLGHTSNKYVMKYAQLAKLYFGGTPKYHSVWVNNREQETKLADEGYALIRTDPKDGACLYRKLEHLPGSSLIGHD
jgi:integrase